MNCNYIIKVITVVAVVMSLIVIAIGVGQIVKNQKLQMKQQFHSDFINLVSLFGENGLNKLHSAKTSKELTTKEAYATELWLQRFLVAYGIKDAWSTEEWQSIEKDIKTVLKSSELLRSRWEQRRAIVFRSEREFLDKIFFEVTDELIKSKTKK